MYVFCTYTYLPSNTCLLAEWGMEQFPWQSCCTMYIDGSFVKHKIPVRPIYITVRNLNSVVSGKARAWRVLGMMPSVCKSATLAQSDTWRKEHRLRLHHACIAHVVDMVNRFCEEDKHVLCADDQVHTCFM